MSLAWTLNSGVPDFSAGTPRLRARRAPRLACHRWYFAFSEHGAEVGGGGVDAFVVEDLGEGHIDVEVVLVERVADAVGRPFGKLAGR